MNWLTWRPSELLSQEVARHNAAAAAGRLMRERRERTDVEAYLARLDHQRPNPTSGTPAAR